ncbi:hypothetical protein EDD15DRAFT_1795029 [Pisolithus albus]|nr:hypothetical protein EDD15DRAFT_1795029 [Pisolithus albus]
MVTVVMAVIIITPAHCNYGNFASSSGMPKFRWPAGTCDVAPLSDSCSFLLSWCDTGAVRRRTSYLFRDAATYKYSSTPKGLIFPPYF